MAAAHIRRRRHRDCSLITLYCNCIPQPSAVILLRTSYLRATASAPPQHAVYSLRHS
uniref:Uncharacterized protein n=1 Tax=uncultured gamma proteobacterium HF0010_01E20 TaxID=710977 RepID=E0XQ97_9GAMM|nr:hypothetical protein [uncultured gamma proteobacterium HF0010_01E20]